MQSKIIIASIISVGAICTGADAVEPNFAISETAVSSSAFDSVLVACLSDAVLEWKVGLQPDFEDDNATVCVSHLMQQRRAARSENNLHYSHHSMWCKGCYWGKHRLYN